jgi:Tfp pilus assembly protein PilN
MIQINLLPDEYRRADRTPVRVFAAITLGVAVNASLGALWLWTELGPGAEVEQRLEVLQSDLTTLRPLVKHHNDLEKERKLYETRERTLDQIVAQRVSWTEKVDQLIDVINEGGDGDQKYLIWLDSLNVAQSERQSRPGMAASGGSLSAKANSGDGDFALVANFLEDVEYSDFGFGFSRPAPPAGSASEPDPDLIPSVVFSFDLGVELLPAAERSKLAAEREMAEQAETEQGQEG